MKKLLLAIVILAFASVANAQLSTPEAFEMPLGTFQGSGKIAGGVHTIKLVNTLGNFLITYGGATRCTAILRETPDAGIFEEIDIWDSTSGKVSKNSCQEKGFVFLVNQGTGLTYHWGSTKDEAMDKPMPVTLKKTRK